MIIKIEAEVSGNFDIEKEMNFKVHPFDIDFRFDLDLNKYYIFISTRIIDYLPFLPKIVISGNKVKEITFPHNHFIEEQIKILQLVESFGAIDKEIVKIDWQNCIIEWIPENDEEAKILTINRYNRDLFYDSKKQIISKDWLQNTIIHRRQIGHLALPFSFFKDGVNFYHNFQYQYAFLNFYLMLEGFFGNGEFKNKLIKAEFNNSAILEKSINYTLDFLHQKKDKHFDWLKNICKKYNKNIDKLGVIHFLVELRGNLSHFSFDNSENMKSPFKDKDYESLAFISMCICRFVSNDLRLLPFKK